MFDRRELIVSRLVQIAKNVVGVKTVARNIPDLSANARPGIVISDGDETADDRIKGLNRPPGTNNILFMAPEVLLLVGSAATQVGTDLNAMRASFLNLLFADALDRTDGALGSIIGENGNVFFEGVNFEYGRERNISGSMLVTLEIRYPFKLAELAP